MEQLKVYAATLEEKAEAQIREMIQSDAYGDCLVRIMPDCHAGAGCTIGTVISLRDRINGIRYTMLKEMEMKELR